ncbi:DNA-binding protein [Streptomyces mayteni]
MTASLISRLAGRYGLEEKAVLSWWQWGAPRPRHESGAVRADAEVLLNAAGRRLLVQLCGVEEVVLARALPSWGRDESAFADQDDGPRAVWRVGGTVVGPVVFGCRLCAARRTGVAVRVVRYAQRWERLCGRHGRWGLDADADHGLEHLDVRSVPEVVAARRRWVGVTRRATRAGVGPERVFGLAYAVVCRWWEQALEWEPERIWPARLHAVAGGDATAGGRFWWWRVVARDAVIFPEVGAVADALLDPEMSERVWRDSGAGRPRPLLTDGAFGRALGERVGRPWLGPLGAIDYGGPLIAWMGSVIRRRRGVAGVPGFADDPWWVKREHRPVAMATQLRSLAKEKKQPGSGTRWRSAVPAEQRALITSLIEDAQEQLIQLRGVQTGATVDVARRLLGNLGHASGLLEGAVRQTASAALAAGMPLEEVARLAGLSAEVLAGMLAVDNEQRAGG